ncbi:MlaD family protein [Gracilinema caldarium]|uniref:Mammalian cell entry related domain protein n=1 Tax=Gracilinema caldarium (strain ATCC 51460 / DSM 7334 / H1) TaxID=744872 RepID=F8F160_GRAC1|nr:MlaD family protein [Gracilinema caldarium]AEJ20850.1 Mammalian cell entry related domain protein [Gracilinema caldarium DSM 7334]
MKFRIKYADQIVGTFVLLALVLLAVIFILMGGKQRWFAKDYVYQSRFNSSAGVSAGTGIFYKGFQIGRIQKVILNRDNMVDTTFVIYDTYIDKVTENSLLELVISPIGLGNQLLFHPGKSSVHLPEKSFIPSYDLPEGRSLVEQDLVDRPPKDDTISRLLSNINPLIENINDTVVQLKKTLMILNGAVAGSGTGPVAEAVRDAADSVQQLERLLGQTNDAVSVLVPRVSGIMTQVETSLPSVLGSVSTITGNLAQTSEAFKDPTGLVPRLLDPKGSLKTLLDDGNRLFNHIDESLAQVEQSMKNLEGATATLSAQMPRIAATIDDVRNAIVSAQDVLEGLKNNPLLRGGIPERIDPKSAPTGLRNNDF